VVLLGMSAAPASAAVAAFRAQVTVRTDCFDAYTQTSPTGVTRGVMWCGGATKTLVFFTGNGTSWTKVPTGVAGNPVAFADDGTSYYAIYAPSAGKGAVVLLKRNHSTGAQTRTTLRAATAATADDSLDYGALVVSGGKYWAAFTYSNGNITSGSTLTRQTLVPSLPRALPAVSGQQPALARRGTTGVVMVVVQPPPFEAGTVVQYVSRAGGTWSRTAFTGTGGHGPQVIYRNGVTQISWLQASPTGYHVKYQTNASGAWVRRTVAGLTGTGWPRLRMFETGGKLTFVYSGLPAGGRPGTGKIVVTQRSGSVWSTTSLGSAADGARLLGAGGWSGKTIVVYTLPFASTSPICSRRQA
jgi:hypothetical protein